MNDLPFSPPLDPPTNGELPPKLLGPKQRLNSNPESKRITILIVLVILMLIAMVMQWWYTNNEQALMRNEVARRLLKDDSLNSDTRLLVKILQEDNKELQTKVNVLEAKQQEAQSQQLALSQLYQDLSKNQDYWTLSGIEQTISSANEQLQIAGNVQGALIALQNAERNLSTSNQAQFFSVRKAITRDIEKLKIVPNINISNIAIKLDTMIAQVDSLPLISSEQPAPQTAKSSPDKTLSTKLSNNKNSFLSVIKERFESAQSSFLSELSELIQIRNVDSHDALLLSTGQSHYLRENIKLSLLNARIALLTRNETTFKNDLAITSNAINNYFDTHTKPVRLFQTQIKTFMDTKISANLPNLNDSLNALNHYKAKP